MRVNVADFGALPDGNDATKGVRAAIARLPLTGGAILYFPPGIYRFGATTDPTFYFFDIENLQIDATGSTFLFRDAGFPILAKECRNITLRGITIDWERPPFSQGEVVSISTDRLSIDLQIDPEFPVDGSESIATIATYDREVGLMSLAGVDAYIQPPAITRIADQRLKLTLGAALPLRAGDTIVARHHLPRNNHAITLIDCTDVLLDGLKIYASPNMAVVGGRCHDVTIRDLNVSPRPSSSRLMSTNADAVHFANGTGRLEVTHSMLKGMGDDCINVHGQYLKLLGAPIGRTVTVATKSGAPFNAADAPRAGDEFVFVDPSTLKSRGVARVIHAEQGNFETIVFDNALPAEVEPGDFLCNTSSKTSLLVSRCSFPGNRARGVLAHGDAVIEHCQFANQFNQAILLLPDAYWMEGCAAENVHITNNKIENSVRSGRQDQGAITIDALAAVKGTFRSTDAIVNHNIVVNKNRIESSNAIGISANAVRDLEIKENSFQNSKNSPIVIRAAQGVVIQNNRCSPAAEITVFPSSKDEVKFENNVGLTL